MSKEVSEIVHAKDYKIQYSKNGDVVIDGQLFNIVLVPLLYPDDLSKSFWQIKADDVSHLYEGVGANTPKRVARLLASGKGTHSLTYGEIKPHSITNEVLRGLHLKSDDIVYDLGSGTGKIPMQIALHAYSDGVNILSKGIELALDRHKSAEAALEKMRSLTVESVKERLLKFITKSEVEEYESKSKKLSGYETVVRSIHSLFNIKEKDIHSVAESLVRSVHAVSNVKNPRLFFIHGDILRYDITDATSIFVNNRVFDANLMIPLMNRLRSLPNIERLVTIMPICARHSLRCKSRNEPCADFEEVVEESGLCYPTWDETVQYHTYKWHDLPTGPPKVQRYPLGVVPVPREMFVLSDEDIQNVPQSSVERGRASRPSPFPPKVHREPLKDELLPEPSLTVRVAPAVRHSRTRTPERARKASSAPSTPRSGNIVLPLPGLVQAKVIDPGLDDLVFPLSGPPSRASSLPPLMPVSVAPSDDRLARASPVDPDSLKHTNEGQRLGIRAARNRLNLPGESGFSSIINGRPDSPYEILMSVFPADNSSGAFESSCSASVSKPIPTRVHASTQLESTPACVTSAEVALADPVAVEKPLVPPSTPSRRSTRAGSEDLSAEVATPARDVQTPGRRRRATSSDSCNSAEMGRISKSPARITSTSAPVRSTRKAVPTTTRSITPVNSSSNIVH